MKRLLLLLILALPIYSTAQHFELGVLAGGSTYDGDLMPTRIQPLIKEMHFAGGAFVRYNINDYITARLGVNYAKISGDDIHSTTGANRNLSFQSNILEFGLQGEFNILGYQPYALQSIFSPYIFGGINVFKFNPQTEYEGQLVDLQPLGTEGQGLDAYPDRAFYKLTEYSIPMGVGVKFALNDAINIGFEMGARMLFTDYIDDVSTTYVDKELLRIARGDLAAELSDRRTEVPTDTDTTTTGRGNSSARDWYYITGVTLSYNFLDNGLSGSRKRGGRGQDCYSF